MFYKSVLGFMVTCLLSACASMSQTQTAEIPLLQAWYEGKKVYYITTDVSDQAIAKVKGANYSPRMQDAIPSYPKPPQVRTVLERVYAFLNAEQISVFSSAPEPIGYQSKNTHYSPLWLMYTVVWNDASKAYDLKSEGAILDAQAEGLITITRTNVVLNCPILSIGDNG